MSDQFTFRTPVVKETTIPIPAGARKLAQEYCKDLEAWIEDKIENGTPAQKRRALFLKTVAGVE
jgi:hypothetical protein